MKIWISLLTAGLVVWSAMSVTSITKDVLTQERQEIVERRDSLLNEPYSEELRQVNMELADFDRQFRHIL